jgi:recombination associated protein RdgC
MEMGLLSATTSLSRYKVDGQLDDPIIDTIAAGLKKNRITDIDGNPSERAVGWSSFQDPFKPDFEGSNFMMGTSIVFALRIDKKSIPNKMIQKHVAIESSKRLHELGRDFLSANEKKMIKDHVINQLSLKMPATPNVYDVVWQYESNDLWFFSNLKSANEELETLFIKSFGLNLVRSIPYTMAALDKRMSPAEQDALNKLSSQQDS